MKGILLKSILGILIIAVLFGIGYFVLDFFSNKNIKDNDMIVVVSPIKDAIISSPLSISGKARGNWYFEGSFPVILMDNYKNVIAEGHVTAQEEWTTNDFVKFIGSIEFNNFIKGSKGFLVLKKDNPSGLIENDDSIEIPIIFK